MKMLVVGVAVMAVFMFGVPAGLAWSGSRRKLRVARPGGVAVLRMPRGHNAILASLAIAPCFLFASIALMVDWQKGAEANGPVLAAFMGLLGAVGGGYLLLLERRGCLRLDESGFERVGAIRRTRARWSDVVRLTYNPVNAWFFLTLRSGTRIYVNTALSGVVDFAELALRHLPDAVLAASPDAAQELREIERW